MIARVRPHLPLLVVSALVVVAHSVNLTGWPVMGDDEGTYTAQAWAVLHGDLAHYTYWYDHPPFGWIQLAVIFWPAHLFGVVPTVATARLVLIGYTLLTCVLLHRLAGNLGLHHWSRAAVVLLWGLSPLVIYEARQVLLDNLQLPWVLGAFVLATDGRRSLWAHLLAGVSFGIGVLTKETSLILFPAFVLALWATVYRPTRWFSMVGAALTTGLTVLVYPLFAALKNELVSGPGHVSLQDAIRFQLASRAGSGVLWDETSPARGIIGGWLALDPVLPVVGLVAAAGCLFVTRLRPVGVAVLTFAAVGARPGGYLPAMFVVVALPFCALAVVAVAEWVGRAVATLLLTRAPSGAHVRRHLVAQVVGAAVLVGVPTMARADGYGGLTAGDANANYRAALTYLETSIPRDTRILVDDSYWTNLVAAGWSGDGWSGAIWYYKIDLDPVSRTAALAGGWRDVDYVVVNRQVRAGLEAPQTTQLCNAVGNSAVVAAFGHGDDRVEVHRVKQSAPELPHCTKGGR